MRSQRIPLPPLGEQRRIARIVMDQLAAVHRARQAAEERLSAAGGLPAAFLRQVFPLRGQPLPHGWQWVRLKQLAQRIDYGYTAAAATEVLSPKFLRITDIQDGRVDWDEVPGCKIADTELNSYTLTDGDILFARTGATTGKSYLIDSPPLAVFASYLIRVRPAEDRIRPEYLYAFFQCEAYWHQIASGVRGGAQGGFNASMLGELWVPLAPIPEQQQISARLRDQVTTAGMARMAAQEALNAVNMLPAAILRRAFSGGI